MNFLKNEIKTLKESKEIKNSFLFDKSLIISEEEFLFIKKEIEFRLKKEIKEIKNIYTSTRDGGDPINFHSKCDYIPNTLTIIKSNGNRRFGGFNSLTWETTRKDDFNDWKDDKMAFLISFDKKNIFL